MAQMNNIMKQALDVQKKMEQVQQDLQKHTLDGASGGGMVKVTVSGKGEMRSIKIDPKLFDEDRELLEDLIVAACNDAQKKAQEYSKEQMAAVSGGLQLPGGFQFPF